MKQKIITRFRHLAAFFRLSRDWRIFLWLFLLPLFFVLHGNNENFGIIPLFVLSHLLLKYLLITFIILLVNVWWFKTPGKGFAFAFYLLLLFFFYGAFYDGLMHAFPSSRIYSYRVLLPAMLLFTCLIYWLIHRSGKMLGRVKKYLVAVAVLFVSLELVYTIYFTFTGKAKKNDLAADTRLNSASLINCDNDSLPDIYFIVFDGYTSSSMLAQDFGFSNAELDSSLARANFFTSRSSRSNYNFTAYSLGSTFNLNYLASGVEDAPITPRNVMQAVNTLKHNTLVDLLAARGYQFRNYGRFVMDHMPSEQVSFFDYYYYDLIDNQTLYERIKRDIGWNLAARNLLTGKFQVPERYRKFKKAHLKRNEDNFQQLIHELSISDSSPRFVYTHLMLPHEPFYLRADGSMAPDSAIIFNTLDERKGYIEQVKYSNRLLKQIIDLANHESQRGRVVIIEGDHGYRFWDGDNLEKEFPNLNTYYFSDHDYHLLHDGISPVNSFRVVLNKYFCQQLPLLKDSSIYLKKPGQ